MSFLNFKSTEITDFRGPWLRREATDAPPDGALLSLNAEYNQGTVGTRKGFTQVWNPAENIVSMFNWVKNPDSVSAQGNYLIYYNTTNNKCRIVPDLATPIPADLFTQAGAKGASIVSAGTRVYIATFTSAGAGAGQCRVTGIYGAALNTDTCFMRPITTKPVLTDTGTGNVTAGVHRVGYLLTSRNGFSTKLSPITSAGAFDITSTVTSSGGKQIGFALTATVPTECDNYGTIVPVMTTASNLNRYYVVPGLSLATVPGAWTYNFTIDISDDDLAATATDVTDNTLLLTQTAGGTGPFNPFSVAEYGSRVCYMTNIDGIPQAYFSDPIRPQAITADQHVVFLPGFRQISTGMALRKTFYFFGPHWTYAVDDNGDLPATWAIPQLIDGSIGTMSPTGVAINNTQGFIWVADQGGLYLFTGGSYPSKPVSYEVEPDWKRINWKDYGYTVQVVDRQDRQTVFVQVALDNAPGPSHIMAFDYSNGTEPDQIKYSLWNISGGLPGAICAVQSPATKRVGLWVADWSARKVYRQMIEPSDATPYNDNGMAIDFEYETALQPGMNASMGMVYAHHGAQIRVQGSGSPVVGTYGIDGTKVVAWPTIGLSALPGAEVTKRFYLLSEGASTRFYMNQVPNTYMLLSSYKHFYAPWVGWR